ncbi:MAG: cation:proton antiporter, partial [Thermotogaceae bacterium]|nr:cation:proton antiporter [Thermotogaceae bacterium]
MSFVIYNLIMILFSFIYIFLKRYSRSIFLFQNVLNFFIALLIFIRKFSFNIVLMDLFGVHLILDEISMYFILLNAIVFLGISLKGVEDETLIFLLSTTSFSLNLLFLSYDLFNLYVMIELVSLLTFLLIVHGRKISQYWAALKYIILGSLGMNLYLVGVAIVYRSNYSFSIQDVKNIPTIALSLMLTGVMIRSGVFLFSMWLPQAHAEAETVVSAVLSGVVVKTGVYTLLRLATFSKSEHIVSYFGAVSAVLGVIFAFLSDDYKKILSYHTLSQVGIILSSFKTAPLYSLAHGVF